ncbi:MarR family winged helix-turn-helix transcriptional regulator [Pseudooceanicola sp. HF7]|uniref:MarR family winged helix-turn-helix transcriptional regulator n=1 Tax=Pseudooceanicola sp. HF7 TaxID=2721560 RepID=UPI0014305026|nr:MarR family transcriptional regulator [Pseudooceanicola sp. HF7]NIZ08057.1 MarR family transcriptional regulator [Pseudooceanicola sp. HF7]
MHYEFKDKASNAYRLEAQVGFLLRRASQRHLSIFSQLLPDLTSTQFAALAKLCELGPTSQNALGRAVAMDAATIKGVADRLRARGLVDAAADPDDRRRHYLSPTAEGQAVYERTARAAMAITEETLAPLTEEEQGTFIRLLLKLC